MDNNMAIDTLIIEGAIYDQDQNILYVAEKEDHLMSGIKEYHLSALDEKLLEQIEEHGSLRNFCEKNIHPEAGQDNEFGYCIQKPIVHDKDYGQENGKVNRKQWNEYLLSVRHFYDDFVHSINLDSIVKEPTCDELAEMLEWKKVEQYQDVVPVVDWRGFTEQDFENLQADRMYDPKYEYNHIFYAGDVMLSVEDSVRYNEKSINLYALENGGTPEASFHNFYKSIGLQMPEVKKMTYEEFQDKVESHLRDAIRSDKHDMLPAQKIFLAENLAKPSPKSWAYAHLYELTALSKELIREDGKSLSDIEKEWVKPNSRKVKLLHGGSKNLMSKLKKELEKDKEIKKILSAQKGR